MKVIHDFISRQLEKEFSFPVFGAKIIKSACHKKGLELTENQLIEIEDKLRAFKEPPQFLNLNLTDEQKEKLGNNLDTNITINVAEEINLDQLFTKASDTITVSIQQLIEEIYSSMYTSLMEDLPHIRKN